jgi:hypothetical protein
MPTGLLVNAGISSLLFTAVFPELLKLYTDITTTGKYQRLKISCPIKKTMFGIGEETHCNSL